MNKLTKALGIGSLVMALMGCSSNVQSGTIISKSYESERNWIGDSKKNENPNCRYFDDEDYILEVAGSSGWSNALIQNIYVTKDVFNLAKKGDKFQVDRSYIHIGDQQLTASQVEFDDPIFLRLATEQDKALYGNETNVLEKM